jgi:hypothetical protein
MMVFKRQRAQSFVEFALVLPILILILLGVVEVTVFIGSYINLLDLSREASRFASNRDPFSTSMQGDTDCGTTDSANFFYDTACIFSPLENSTSCTDDTFCNGFNSTVPLKAAEDDILVYVFTESKPGSAPQITSNAVCDISTAHGCDPWVWSNHDGDTAHQDNWLRDCNRRAVPGTYTANFTPAVMQSYLRPTAIPEKGFVVVEVIYCYHQVLNIPILSRFLPNPILIDTYSIMPLPAAQPTPVP